MRKFKLTISTDPIDKIREIECTEVISGNTFIYFLGPQFKQMDEYDTFDIDNSRILLAIPRENLISLEEIF